MGTKLRKNGRLTVFTQNLIEGQHSKTDENQHGLGGNGQAHEAPLDLCALSGTVEDGAQGFTDGEGFQHVIQAWAAFRYLIFGQVL